MMTRARPGTYSNAEGYRLRADTLQEIRAAEQDPGIARIYAKLT
jgi:hypothetical protein